MRPNWLNPVLWSYPPTVPTERLVRHYHICSRLIRLWLWSLVAMLAGLCQVLLFESRIEMVIMLVATAACLVVSIPAVCSLLWKDEIEKTLERRGVGLPAVQALERYSIRSMAKVFFWLAALALVITWLSRGD